MKIVFVLGAGASSGLDYPLGSDLRKAIFETFHSPKRLRDKILAAGNSETDLRDFEDKLLHADFRTIDQFLEARFDTEHIRKIGREALAGTLSAFEHRPKLFQGSPHWYQGLLEFLWRNQSIITSESLSVVSFNYDRSLRHYLFKALTSRTDKFNDSLATGFLGGKNVIQVHGHIGFLPWQVLPNDRPHRARDYGDPMEADHLVNAGRSLLLPHETFALASEARQRIQDAELVAFLGFGFHPPNLERIGFENILKSKARVYATAMHLLPEVHTRISSPHLTLVEATVEQFVPQLLARIEDGKLDDWEPTRSFRKRVGRVVK